MNQNMKSHVSPRDLGRAIGVSESTLKRWADEGAVRVHRTAGGHRRIKLAEAVRFIRETGMPLVEPHLLGMPDLEGPCDPGASVDDQVRRALEMGRLDQARTLVQSLYVEGHSLPQIFDGPITRAMHEIGRLWESRGDGVYVEHRATDVCIAVLNQLRGLLSEPSRKDPLAMGGGAANDPYVLPSLMAAMVLVDEGWQALNLGPYTPFEVLADSAEQEGATLIWLSVSGERGPSSTEIVRFAKQLAERGAGLVVGGRALPNRAKLQSPNLLVADSMAELAAFAGGIRARASHGPAPSAEGPDADS